MSNKVFSIELSQSEVEKLEKLLKIENNYILHKEKEDLFTIENFFINNTNQQMDAVLVTIFKFIDNETSHSTYELIDKLANDIWTSYFYDPNQNHNSEDLFNLDEFQKIMLSNELDKLITNEYEKKNIITIRKIAKFFDKNYKNETPTKEDLTFLIEKNIKDILVYNAINKSDLSDQIINAIVNIYFIVKLNAFSKLLKLNKIFIKTEDINLDLFHFNYYCSKLMLDDDLDRTRSKNHEVEKILKNTEKYLKNILKSSDYELLEFNDAHFGSLYDGKKFNKFVKTLNKANANLYKFSNMNDIGNIFFVLCEVYLTKIKLLKVYDDIENLLHIFKSFRKTTKEVPYSICDDKIFNLFNFNNIFPKRLLNIYLTSIFALYLKSSYENTRQLLSVLLINTGRRIKATEFAPSKEKKRFENMNVNVRIMIEHINQTALV